MDLTFWLGVSFVIFCLEHGNTLRVTTTVQQLHELRLIELACMSVRDGAVLVVHIKLYIKLMSFYNKRNTSTQTMQRYRSGNDEVVVLVESIVACRMVAIEEL